jgi:myo-inositol-1(or 4)-monophosphatase
VDAGRGEILSAARGLGARLDGVPVAASTTTDLAGTVVLTELASYTPWPGQLAFLGHMAKREATVRIMGSSALALATVATGRAAATVLGGAYSTLDVAAGALIAQEAGARMFGHDGAEASRSDGPPANGMLVAAPGVAEDLRHDLLAALAPAFDEV